MNNEPKNQSNGPRSSGASSTASSPAAPAASVAAVGNQAKQVATDLAVQAKDKIGSELDAQKDRAVGSIGHVAEALRETGRSMRTGDAAIAADYADRLADRIDELTGYVRNRPLSEIAADVEQLARREPALFFGGALAVGLVAGRFLKSSGRNDLDRGAPSRDGFAAPRQDRSRAYGAMTPHPVQGQPPVGSATLAGVGAARGAPTGSYGASQAASYSAYSGNEKGASKP
jgi:hypothetical protein